ncbi:MAG: hypothetical protein Q8R24_07790 [Legionellaceae bacterium]|nr:hypothetical protein [Legionellaceae bacterium]
MSSNQRDLSTEFEFMEIGDAHPWHGRLSLHQPEANASVKNQMPLSYDGGTIAHQMDNEMISMFLTVPNLNRFFFDTQRIRQRFSLEQLTKLTLQYERGGAVGFFHFSYFPKDHDFWWVTHVSPEKEIVVLYNPRKISNSRQNRTQDMKNTLRRLFGHLDNFESRLTDLNVTDISFLSSDSRKNTFLGQLVMAFMLNEESKMQQKIRWLKILSTVDQIPSIPNMVTDQNVSVGTLKLRLMCYDFSASNYDRVDNILSRLKSTIINYKATVDLNDQINKYANQSSYTWSQIGGALLSLTITLGGLSTVIAIGILWWYPPVCVPFLIAYGLGSLFNVSVISDSIYHHTIAYCNKNRLTNANPDITNVTSQLTTEMRNQIKELGTEVASIAQAPTESQSLKLLACK